MALLAVGCPEEDVNPAAIGFPSRDPCVKMVVCVLDPAVVLDLVIILSGSEIRVAAQPELFNEAVSFLAGCQIAENLSLVRGDDVGHVLFQPLLVIIDRLFLSLPVAFRGALEQGILPGPGVSEKRGTFPEAGRLWFVDPSKRRLLRTGTSTPPGRCGAAGRQRSCRTSKMRS